MNTRDIDTTSDIDAMLRDGAAVALSISGGKDSQALLKCVAEYVRERGNGNPIFAIHAHLGRAEWPQTMGHCLAICEQVGVTLVVVERARGDLVDRWKERMTVLNGSGKPFWSSAKNRYCTSDMKRGPINKHLRGYDCVISVEGIRAEESKARAQKPIAHVRKEITTRTRRAMTWNPLLTWPMGDVYKSWGQGVPQLLDAREAFKMTGRVPEWWNYHPAYAMGNDRLSCAICVLGSKNDVYNGVRHNPDLADELIEMEIQSGFSFKAKQSLADIKNEITEVAP